MNQPLSELEIQLFYSIQQNNVEKCKEILCTQLININKLYKTTKEYFPGQKGFVLKEVLLTENNNFGRCSIEKDLTPLMLAAINGNNLLIELFIENGADINLQTSNHRDSALTVAVISGKIVSIQLLLEKGANPNVFHIIYTNYDDEYPYYQWNTPLLYSIYRIHYIEITKLLFQFGADIHIKYEDNMLYNSEEFSIGIYDNSTIGNHLILNRLLKIFHHKLEYLLEIIPLFIQKSLEINEIDEYEMTPLLYAMKSNNFELVKLMFENGANIYQGDSLPEIFRECNDEIKEYVTEYINKPYVLK